MSASVHLVWEMTPTDPLKLYSDGVHVQFFFFFLMVSYLLLTWRPREFGILTEVSVQEIPALPVALILLSLLTVFHVGCATASHFLEIKSPPLLPISLLSPHDENIVCFFARDGKARTSFVLWSFALTALRWQFTLSRELF